jgi:ribose-phosphate pyrophosphokinase
MERPTTKRMMLYSGTAHRELAEEIAAELGETLGEPNIRSFKNGELYCRFDESVRGCDVFIIQTHSTPINEAIMEQLIMIDAAKRGSAKRITAVCPYYGYGRQDRKAMNREPITAKLLADMLTVAGADRMVSIDLHAGQIQGFFDKPVDHLTAMPVLLDHLREHAPPDLVVVSPDAGRIKVAERFSQHLGADLAFIHKRRSKTEAGKVEARGVIGEVAGRPCVVIDDMIDSGATIVAAAEILRKEGATDVWCAATHAVLSDPATDRLKNSEYSKVVLTNTLPIPSEKQHDKLEVLSVASIFARAISAIFEDTSVSDIFGGENLS